MDTGIVITPELSVSKQEFGEPLHRTIGKAIDGHLEVVHPMLLPRPYCMIVDEEGLLKEKQMNPFASVLYGYVAHGQPIVGTVVLMKEGIRDGEPDIVGLDEEDIKTIINPLISAFYMPPI